MRCRPLKNKSVLKGTVFYGQGPPSGESTTTECGVNTCKLDLFF